MGVKGSETMNVFFISPGRTATTTLANAFKCIEGYSSLHESRVQLLGDERIAYPENHIEFDNRLVFFLADLTQKFAADRGVLVIVCRDHHAVAGSYNRRWSKINIMKSWSQGIHLRDLNQNNYEVALDFVQYCYRQLDYFKMQWECVVELDVHNPEAGIQELLHIMGESEYADEVSQYLKEKYHNLNENGLRNKIADLWFNVRCLAKDLLE